MKRLLIYIFVFAALPALARDIDEYALEIALNNPEVLAAKSNYEAQLESARAENVLGGPEVDFGYKFGQEGRESNRWSLGVGQSFDFPGAYRARAKANGYRAEAFENLYRGALLESALEAKQLLIKAAAARQKVDILATADANVQKLSEYYQRAYSLGETTMLEIKKLELERFDISLRYARAQAELEACIGTLKALSGSDAEPYVPSTMPLPMLGAYSEYAEALAANDPVVAASNDLYNVASAEVSVSKLSALPSFKLSYTHDYEDMRHFNGFSVGIELPAWSRRHSVKAAEALLAVQSNNEYSMRRNAELSGDYALATRLAARVEKARATFESDEYTALLAKALDGGRIDIFEYLREYNDYLDSNAEYVELRCELALALTSLNRYSLLK